MTLVFRDGLKYGEKEKDRVKRENMKKIEKKKKNTK